MQSDEKFSELDSPLWGAETIATEINRTIRQTFHLLESGVLPADKVGGRWVSTPRRLRRLFEGRES
jgi:hypothetical protein